MSIPGCDFSTITLQNITTGGNWTKGTRDISVLFLTAATLKR